MFATNYREVRVPLRGLRLARGLARNAVLSAHGLVARPSRTPALRLFYCHYVFDDQRRQLETIIRYLQGVGRFITTDQVVDILNAGKPLTENLFHLSFDDGKKSVISNALPILRDLGVPAILFVPTAIISSPRGQFEEHRHISEESPALVEISTWDDLERTRALDFEIGSHTRTHARFSEISGSQQAMDDEFFGSKQDIESRLGGVCDYISWPYGRPSDTDSTALKAVERAGYRACFGAFRGQVVPGVTNLFQIPRHNFEPEWPLSHVKCFANGMGEAH